MKNTLFLCIAIFLLSACNTGSKATTESNTPNTTPIVDDEMSDLNDDPVFYIHRESCRGYCPGYSYSIYESGKVDYFGQRNVDRLGNQIATMEMKILLDLIQLAKEIGFTQLEDKYIIPNVADVPAFTITHSDKTIVFYESKAPKDLLNLFSALDKKLDQLVWEKVD